jgi:sulfonate transport system substrate-binding protein
VAVFKGTNLQLAFYNVLTSKGLKESDFKTINMSTFDGNAALLSKDIDAQVSGNDLVPLVDRGVVRIIYDTQKELKLTRLTHVLVTEDFEHKYPEIVQRLVNTLLKTAAWEADEANRGKTYQIWVKSGLGLSAWKRDYDAFKAFGTAILLSLMTSIGRTTSVFSRPAGSSSWSAGTLTSTAGLTRPT